jgi:hypothetical protein
LSSNCLFIKVIFNRICVCITDIKQHCVGEAKRIEVLCKPHKIVNAGNLADYAIDLT